MELNTLGDAMRLIRTTYTEDHYPHIHELPMGQRKAFMLRHGVLHMSKSLGKLAAECEAVDHGDSADETALRRANTRMLIHALKMAEDLGMAEADLLREIQASI